MKQNKKFDDYCDLFIEHAIKYSYKESKQIETEKLAYKNGVISQANYLNLKEARQNTALLINNIAYKLKLASKKIHNISDDHNLYNLIEAMIKICDA